MFFSAGSAKSARALLGATRIEIAKRLDMIDPDAWAFTWVVDWPLFEAADEATASGDVAVGSGAWTAVHHAFTSPKPESEATFDTDPGSALANAYDIVCNGNEIGGGSIRIHRRDVQERVFAMMGIDHDEAQEKFGFLLDAFTFGAPPHGGIAFGWDRITALLAGVGLDPRGHRVPEVRRRRRPADRRAGADHAAAAQGIGTYDAKPQRTAERITRDRRVTSVSTRHAATPMTLRRSTSNIVDEFRANGGKVGGPFEGGTLLLLHTRAPSRARRGCRRWPT